MSGPDRPDRRPALDGLRALAALWVLVYHCWIRTGAGPLGGLGPLAPVIRSGALGVDLFFVLSGCVLTLGLLGRRDPAAAGELRSTDSASVPSRSAIQTAARWWPFVVRRAARLLPAAWVVLAVVVPTAALHQAGTEAVRRAITPESVVANATLLGGVGRLLPGYEGAIGFAANPVMWSLTPEVLFSLLIVLVLPLLARRPAGAVGALLAAGVVLRAAEPSAQVLSVATPLLTSFPVGVAVALLASRRPSLTRGPAALVAGAGLLATIVLTRPEASAGALKAGYAGDAWLPLATAAACGLLCAGALAPTPRGLGAPLPALVGRWSYGLYLWHFPIIGVLVWTAGLPADGSTRSVLLAFLVAAPLSIAAGGASLRWVEAPPQRWAARAMAQRRPAPR